jgi:small-conductance mechanosensitive channel
VHSFLEQLGPWATRLAVLAVLGAAALAVAAALAWGLRRLLRARGWKTGQRRAAWPPLALLFLCLALQTVLPRAGFADDTLELVRHVNGIGLIVAVAWTTLAALDLVERAVKARHAIDVADNLEARAIHTKIDIVTRSIAVLVVVVAVAAVLMTFPRVRQLGTSMLASAGIAGIAVGLAARPVLENLIAGLQIALTQPIRIDDVVIVEGEWGRIEEITSTYVVVRIWDERRLVVPLGRFIQQPFQNWTRTSAEILGTVFLHVDYTVPVDAVRAELKRVVEDADEWDGRVCVLQVTDATETTMQLRALVSAADSGKAWDLRVRVREQLIAWLQREHPDALPRTRVSLETRDDAAGRSPTDSSATR